ncbi:MAG: hypothetical protein QM638_15575 [Nocardioides sp.]|uniref:hypothetical protein n=1 Tax=Nocardioides sp. TaxID=35761 RepID=UPI0039E5DC9B
MVLAPLVTRDASGVLTFPTGAGDPPARDHGLTETRTFALPPWTWASPAYLIVTFFLVPARWNFGSRTIRPAAT